MAPILSLAYGAVKCNVAIIIWMGALIYLAFISYAMWRNLAADWHRFSEREVKR